MEKDVLIDFVNYLRHYNFDSAISKFAPKVSESNIAITLCRHCGDTVYDDKVPYDSLVEWINMVMPSYQCSRSISDINKWVVYLTILDGQEICIWVHLFDYLIDGTIITYD